MSSLDSLDSAVAQAWLHTQSFVSRHTRALAACVLVGTAGFAATAFGIAPMAPDAADLPQRVITEPLALGDLSAQLEALAGHELSLFRSELTRSGDTVDSLFSRLNLVDTQAANFLRSDPVASKLLSGRVGKMVQARSNGNGELVELVARFAPDAPEQFNTHFSRLRIQASGHGPARQFSTRLETAPLEAQVRLGSGTIRQSLFAAADESRLPDPVTIQIAEIFATDIDFRRELRKGDSFSVLYEALTADGEPISWNQASGRVLAAEFVNNGNTFTAVWYQGQQAGAKGAYFDLNGQSKRRSFLASPLEFSRVTSGFSMRFHPILQRWRAHNGVDYGAPTGTPVRSVGDGTVEFAGVQNGYGNVIVLQHSNQRQTVYAHLSRIDVRRGDKVEAGERIGAVGATGWATGPHLHFEFKLRGEHQDPLAVAKSSEAVEIPAQARAQFAEHAKRVRMQLDAAYAMSSHTVAEAE